MLEILERTVDGIRARGQGAFVPLSGRTGTGKTTFASSVTQWKPGYYTNTLEYEGAIDFDHLTQAVERQRKNLPPNDTRIIPINIDHRESSPPTDQERAVIKRFLRTSPGGVPALIFWPEVDSDLARNISEKFTEIAGRQPVEIPVQVEGPDRSMWKDIALNTLRISNSFSSLELIGVDPSNYNPDDFRALGDYLRKISDDFNDQLHNLRTSITKRLELCIIFISESSEPGVLSQLQNNSRYGLVDPHSLIAATPDSVIGKWWSDRRGLLTRTIVQLNTHALFLGPAPVISVIRNCGPAVHELLDAAGVSRVGPARAVRDLTRTDVGKLLLGKDLDRFESRGTPAHDSTAAFQLLAENGLTAGKDKILNKYFSDAYKALLETNKVSFISVENEKQLSFCPLIPDNNIDFGEYILCIEYVWRSSDFLASRRSEAAQYILTKLRNYARELGWSPD